MTPNPAGVLSEVVAELRETAKEYRLEDRSVGIFPDHESADMLCDWADRLESLSRTGDGPVAWRGLNSLGEVVTDWIDGAPPAKFVDLHGNEASYDSIQCAYTHPQAAAQGVTDEMVIAALNAWFSDCGGASDDDVAPENQLFIDMRAAIDAALSKAPA